MRKSSERGRVTAHHRWALLALLVLAAGLPFVLAACGGDGDDETTAAQENPAVEANPTVNVSLGEWFVTPDRSSVESGDVDFSVANDGTVEHEFVVIRTDAPADKLPLSGGDVDEEKAGESPGEIEEFAAGTTEGVTLTLKPGKYVFICNLPGHYQNGQRAEFTAR